MLAKKISNRLFVDTRLLWMQRKVRREMQPKSATDVAAIAEEEAVTNDDENVAK